MYTKAVGLTPSDGTALTATTDGIYIGTTSEGGTGCDISILNPMGETAQSCVHNVGSDTMDIATYIQFCSANTVANTKPAISDPDHIKVGVTKVNTVNTYQPNEAAAIDNYLHTSVDVGPTDTTIRVGHSGSTKNRIVMVWDISDIPSDATVTAASMVLTEETDEVTETMTVRTYRITETSVVEDCDWTNYEGSNAWATEGGDYSTSITSTTTTDGGNLTVNDAGFVSLVQDAIDDRSGNLRIIMISQEDLDDDNSGTQRMRYNTSGAFPSGNRPSLSVTFDCPKVSRGLIRFNLRSIPHDATVTAATLQLNKDTSSWDTTPDATLDRIAVYRQDSTITGGAGWDENVTWQDKKDRESWDTAGGDYIDLAVTYGDGADGTVTVTGAGLINYVQATVDDSTALKGVLELLMISHRDDSSTSLNINAETSFHSGTHASLYPILKVDYTADSFVYSDVQIGVPHPIKCKGVNSTHTTGSNIVGLYYE
jgi:hypothetical protein